MARLRSTIPILLVLCVAACTPAASGSTATVPTPAAGLGPTGLKYLVLDEFPDFFFCDPDYYPIARGDEAERALEIFPELQANAEEFGAILARLGLSGTDAFTDGQKLLIYQEHKKLAALMFVQDAGGYQFQIQVAAEAGQGELVTGQIDSQGSIKITDRTDTIVSCPICLAAGTRIDTPAGSLPVEELRPGMLVWTVDAAGRRVAAPLARLGLTLAPVNHHVIHLVLADGRELWVSPGHPTADGRLAGDLSAGDRLSGGLIVLAESVRYTGAATYDLLPAGETGYYWANGILLGSTLRTGP